VGVQDAPNVVVFNEPREAVFLGKLDLVTTFAKLWWDELKP
jgi:hypothetical protein